MKLNCNITLKMKRKAAFVGGGRSMVPAVLYKCYVLPAVL